MIQVLVYLSFLWLLSEIILMIAKRSKVKSVKKKRDRGSMLIMWICISASITAGFIFANRMKWNSINYLIWFFGLLTYFIGLFIRWSSIIQLKDAFTVDVAINQQHELKTDGLYRFIRHPSYLGLLLIISGLSFGMNSIYSIFVIIIPIFLAVSYRIQVEEKLLMSEFGEKYTQFKLTTKKIIPFIY
jgi:protein-S-isoprenylcysteine O-methyltransferase Ste14